MKRIVLSVMAALALAGGVFALHTEPVKAVNAFDTIENGVFIGNVDVAGMTSEEAAEAVESYVSGLGSKTITLNALNDNKVSVSLSDLGLYWENQDVASEAAELGKSGNIVQRYKALKDLEHENHVYPVETGYKEEKIQKVIEDRCLQYNVEPVDGTLTREDDEFIYTPGQTGVKIDVDASVTAVMDALSSEDPSEGITVELAAETAEPRGSEEQLTA
ncbi:MAG: peptidoglycan binding domain-containing protein, partial [Lachnospiraceae bacterium]|nr:peptidoglycan binding domain-containing protein [Lachnospiraceae bacterium]